MNIFFDLDGTLIDSRERLYRLFQWLVPVSELSFDAYWELKRNKMDHRKILAEKFSFKANSIHEFETAWMHAIELPEWIGYDKPYSGVSQYLQGLKPANNLYIITARQSEEILIKQITEYGWISLFNDVFSTKQQQEKYELLKHTGITREKDWMVTDTGNDILTAKKLGIHSAAVTSGFQSREVLEQYEPDLIANDVTAITFS